VFVGLGADPGELWYGWLQGNTIKGKCWPAAVGSSPKNFENILVHHYARPLEEYPRKRCPQWDSLRPHEQTEVVSKWADNVISRVSGVSSKSMVGKKGNIVLYSKAFKQRAVVLGRSNELWVQGDGNFGRDKVWLAQMRCI
jgi:hypothetical protein